MQDLWFVSVDGDSSFADETRTGRVDLTATLYGELRKLARSRMARQYGPQTLQATALVHEAWLRLGGDEQPGWENRGHFFGAVAKAMRNVLIDRARRRQRIRHGGGLQRAELDTWNWEKLDPSRTENDDQALLALHEALEALEVDDPDTARLAELHFFAGLTVREAAETMELALRTAERRLSFVRIWLGREVRRNLAA